MNRTELHERLSARFPSMFDCQVRDAMNCILDGIQQRLHEGGRVEIRNFGSFSTHVVASRSGRNPRTGEAVFIPVRRVLRFKAGRTLKRVVDQPATSAPCHTDVLVAASSASAG